MGAGRRTEPAKGAQEEHIGHRAEPTPTPSRAESCRDGAKVGEGSFGAAILVKHDNDKEGLQAMCPAS